ncbi:S-layer homology domain-containing protein [Paenibacillus sp. FSL H7-689]|uniref:S-layer homology domain-containing protein n=1 Tax=Paenibacillus sp. FSL H7-689 TaxID=1227349 RepID=UPI0003E227B4|nr:S-layer homology domain-containing protein [Paenibacillus sp. FSL H7-689]ETT51522.1 S-layer domain-containing protein [Paenibacillus sp. FSL H7-689]
MNCAKKLVTTLLITVMLFSSFNVVFGAAESSASDIEGNWAESQITKWIDKGFIHGYEDGSFKPNNTITRAEFFSLVNRSYGFTETATVSFKDVTSSNWAYAEVSKAVKAGYIKGYRDGTIGANKPITRQEVAVIISDLLDLSNEASTGNHFTDSNTIASWAKNSVDAIVAKGILQDYDNNFNPNKPITRAEAVVALDRSVNARATDYSLAGTYGPEAGTQTIDGDVLISAAGVTLKNMIINGNLLFSEGIQEGDVHLTNVTIKGVTRVEGGGVSTIYLKNTVTSTLIVDKKKGPVLIIVEGSTTVGEVTIHSPATLQETDTTGNGFGKITLSERLPAGSKVGLKGTFDSLTIKGSGVQVDIPEGRIKDVIVAVTATGTTLNLGTDATIVNLFLDSVAKILGTGTIEKVTLSSVAKGGTTFETTIRLLDKVINTVTPATPTAHVTSPSTGGTDTIAPTLSNVTSGHIAGGDPVVGRSNENGYLYLVPSATPKTITSLNQSVAGLFGKKQSVTANVDTTMSTAGLASGTYVVYAVDLAYNISMASAEIVIGTNQLTVSAPVLSTEKMYDGTSSATVIADSLTGVAAGDHVTVNAAATYNDAIIGTGKTITVVYTLGGADAAKYIAPSNYTTQTGAITAAQLTIGEPMLTVIEKTDGDSSVVVSSGSLVGVVPGEDVTVSAEAVYDTTSPPNSALVTVVYTIAGTDSGKYIAPANNTNYTVYVQFSVDTGTIIDLITTSKVYDGTLATTALAGSRVGSCGVDEQGICPGDDVTVSASGVYDNENVGTNKKITISYTLLGPPVEVRNYSPPKDIEVVGVITAKQLMITDPTLILSKVYDGTLAANVTPGVLTNVIYGDDVQVNAVATYNNAAVGTSKVITIKYTLTGLDAGNYIAPATQTVGTGEITATP